MVYIKRFLNSATAKKLPKKIVDHPVLKSIHRIDKAFPNIGLPNSRDKCSELVLDENFQQKKVEICFSSDGITGLWDIATMSMRGVSSCMHWRNRHSSHLIGSLIDPITAIIYMTDGSETEYGETILKRAIVRLCCRHKNSFYNKPFILIDRIYTKSKNTDPTIYDNADRYPEKIGQLFKKFIQARVNPKFDVLSAYDKEEARIIYSGHTYLPLHSNLTKLRMGVETPFVDSSLVYKTIRIDELPVFKLANVG